MLQALSGTLTLTDLASESFRLQHQAEQLPSQSPKQMILLQPRRQNQQHLLVSPALEMIASRFLLLQKTECGVDFLAIKGSNFVVPVLVLNLVKCF